MKSHFCIDLRIALAALILPVAFRSICVASEVKHLALNSPSFAAGGVIPATYTCAGSDQSPPLRWNNVPKNTRSLVLILDDPDAPEGDFVHWVIYNLSSNSSGLPAQIPKIAILSSGAHQGVNGFGHIGYNGPCPPLGPPHHYHFRLYALGSLLNLSDNATASDLKQAMRRKVLDAGEMVATFGR
jgi:Raf kinase inhibitor-like YbhB/YbcL family protein